MANGWENNGNSDRLYFGGCKVTVDGDCSHEIKRCLLWKKSYDQLRQHIKKQRHCFANKGPSNQSCGFSSSRMWMWELEYKESWAMEELMLLNCGCWRRLLRFPWTARRANQSILKAISAEYSLERLMLKLKFQHFGHLMRRTNSLEKTLMLEKIEGRRRRGRQRMRWLDGWMVSPTRWTWVWAGSGSWWWTGKPGMLQSMGSQRVEHNWVTELKMWRKGNPCRLLVGI